MFQRFKGIAGNIDQFIDSKLSEEQTKQRSSSPARPSAPGSRSTTPRPQDASLRAGVVRSRSARDPDKLPRSKGPDPSEFVIEDDDEGSRAPTPQPDAASKAQAPTDNGEDPDKKGDEGEKAAKTEQPEAVTPEVSLPAGVQQRLRKLQKLESRYHGT